MVRLLFVLYFFLTNFASAQTAWHPEVKLTLTPDPMPAQPFVGEMVLATLRGEYIGNVALEHLSVPNFQDFSWLQLNAPVWFEERIKNRLTKVMEQRFAFFPRKAGALTIGPIIHDLTFAGGGKRVNIKATSAPIVIDTRARPDTGRSWWLPARNLSVTDVWDPEPNTLAPDEWTRRTVTITATGLPAEALPPSPPMAAGGMFSFIDPEERSFRLTPDGPIATVVWRYRMQPQSDAPADLDDITIPWFDTSARMRREVLLEGREIAFAASSLPTKPGPLARNAIRIGAISGALFGLAILLPRIGTERGQLPARLRKSVMTHYLIFRLGRAERLGNEALVRRSLIQILDLNNIEPLASTTLQALDRRIYRREKFDCMPGIIGMVYAEIFKCFNKNNNI